MTRGPVPFPTTHWSAIHRAADGRQEGSRNALGEFLQRYLPALQTYLVLSKRMAPDHADDHLQSFVLDKIIRDTILAHADRHRGRFRTFLLAVLDNYRITARRKEHARQRMPDAPVLEVDERTVAGPGAGPQFAFELAWAKEVVANSLATMEQECLRTGRADVWGVFQGRIADPMLEGRSPTPYAELVQRYGFRSPSEAFNVLVTGKRMFTRALRTVVGEYALDQQEIEEEIRDLRSILAQSRA